MVAKTSRRVGRGRSPLRIFLDRRIIKTTAWVKRLLFPIYRRLGINSIVGLVVPGYRQVTKSPGGRHLTATLIDTGSPQLTIATVGDYGSGKTPSFDVRDLVVSQKSNAVVTLGDNVYYETGFQALVGDLYGDYLKAGAFFPATGNHDYREGRGIANFDGYFRFLDGHRWYSVSIGPVDFFLVDSHQALHHEDVFEKQRAWLEEATTRSEATWKVVVTHHPPHSARARSQEEFRLPYDKWGVSMVMSGHDHTMQHLVVDNVHYVVNGVGGGSLHYFEEILEGTEFRLSDHFGAVFLDVDDSELVVRFITIDTGEVHRFAIPAPK